MKNKICCLKICLNVSPTFSEVESNIRKISYFKGWFIVIGFIEKSLAATNFTDFFFMYFVAKVLQFGDNCMRGTLLAGYLTSALTIND